MMRPFVIMPTAVHRMHDMLMKMSSPEIHM
jgi:hypothetical protein